MIINPITIKGALTLASAVAMTAKLGGKALANAAASARADSMVKFTEAARLEPIVALDRRLAQTPETPDALKTMASLFIAYYLQSIALDVEVNGVKVLRKLEKFGTDRDIVNASANFLTSMESRPIGLDFKDHTLGLEAYQPAETISMEAQGSYEEKVERAINDALLKKAVQEAVNPPSATGSMSVKDATKLATDIGNLAVGKILEVKIEQNGAAATIPVTFRQRVMGMDSQVMVDLYSLSGQDTSIRALWRQFKADEIQFWRDIVFAMSRVDEFYKNAIKDKTGYYRTLASRQIRQKVASFLEGKGGLGMINACALIHEDTKLAIEGKLGRKLSDFAARQQIFDSNMLMLMGILDPEWNSITIYHRGIAEGTELPFSAIKNGGKGDDNIVEILKAFQLGQAPGRL
ncbi:hypothetical protein ACLPJK_26370 [Pseudomonas aeruginosa]|uniref:hypothetical protein n=1 Tax=Pseudomonas aeruginosa TaxID=287 RepID=UPI003D286FAC